MTSIHLDRKVRTLDGKQGLWLKIPAQIVRKLDLTDEDTFAWTCGAHTVNARAFKPRRDDD